MQIGNLMFYALLAMIAGLLLLVWSADRFIDGAVVMARHFGMPPLWVGMVIVGFGTSAPEMVVSLMSALDGSPGIALGNAYGSNIANIALILGITVLISPMRVGRQVAKTELPVLLAITALTAWLLADQRLDTGDGALLLAILAAHMLWTVARAQHPANQTAMPAADTARGSLDRGLLLLILGLVVLVLSARLLVWGAVGVAQRLGVSDLVIGLTVVAVGTSLPELASSIVAARRGEHDIALGNVVGSNLFNTLAVVGLAALVAPMDVAPAILQREVPVMSALTLLLFVFCLGRNGHAAIGRGKGSLLLAAYLAYTAHLAGSSLPGGSG